MLRTMGRQINHFRVPLAVVVAASMAMAVWAPASAAAPPGFRAPAVAGSSHGMASFPGAHAPLLNPFHPRTIQRDTTTTYSFYSGLAGVKTTSGATRGEYIDANKGSSTGAANATVGLIRHNSSFSQAAYNEWSFGNLVTTDFSPSGGNATVTLKSTQIGAFGSLSGTFTHTASHSLKCSSGSETQYTGTFKLTEHFYTKNSLESNSTLGAVYGPSGTGGTITFPNTSTNTSVLYVDNGCVPVFPVTKNYCLLDTDWSSPFVSSTGLEFYGIKQTVESPTPSSFAAVGGSRSVHIGGLPSTGGFGGTAVILYRTDAVSDGSFTSQSYSSSSTSPYPLKEVATAPSSDAYMQGSATLRSAASATSSYGTCYAGSTAKTQHVRYSKPNYAWTNGTTPLTGDSAVGGNITLSSRTGQTTGSIDHYSYS